MYTAPELYSGEYSKAMDVYSFGITCMEIWDQRYPFIDPDVDALQNGTIYYCVCPLLSPW